MAPDLIMRKLLILIAFIHLLLISCLRSPDPLAETDCEYLLNRPDYFSNFPLVAELLPSWKLPNFINNETLVVVQSEKKFDSWVELNIRTGKTKKLGKTSNRAIQFVDYSDKNGLLFTWQGVPNIISLTPFESRIVEFHEPVIAMLWYGDHLLCRPPGFTGQMLIYSQSGDIIKSISTPEYFKDVWMDENTLIVMGEDSIRCWAYPSMLPIWSHDYRGLYKVSPQNLYMFSDLQAGLAVNPKSVVQGFVTEVYFANASQIVRYNVLTREVTPVWHQYGCFMLDSRMSISDDGKYLAITIAELQNVVEKKLGILVLNLETGQETTYFP